MIRIIHVSFDCTLHFDKLVFALDFAIFVEIRFRSLKINFCIYDVILTRARDQNLVE